MRIDLISIFPEAFTSFLQTGLLAKAIGAGVVEVELHDLRRWAPPPHRKLDDLPFGGGAGMVMSAGPIVEAVEAIGLGDAGPLLVCSASGKRFDQEMAAELAGADRFALVCGRYEGIDHRAIEVLGATEVSIGDYVLAGGESAALVIVEAVTRLLPGVMGNPDSLLEESFSNGLLEYPHFTRPAEFRGQKVPEVLLSGNHAAIARWRREQALRRTWSQRPELLERADLTDEEAAMVRGWGEAAAPEDH